MRDLIGHRLPSRLTLQNISRNLAFKFLTFDGRHGNFPHPHDAYNIKESIKEVNYLVLIFF